MKSDSSSVASVKDIKNGDRLAILISYVVSFSSFASAGCLRSLRLPRSNMSDLVVEQIAGKFSMLTYLDVSYCIKIGASAIETIGKNCKMLEGLCRNMHPLDTAGKPLQDDEAYAIASTMPKLKHLEMAYHRISTPGVVRILSN
jgi:hypothetical protein